MGVLTGCCYAAADEDRALRLIAFVMLLLVDCYGMPMKATE